MGKKIVIDACVAIDLNVHKVSFLDDFLNVLGEDTIHISSINYQEIFNGDIRRKLQRSPKVSIHENDQSAFEQFSDELEPLKINMGKKDRHVLFLAKTIDADYVVSSDLNVVDKTEKYQRYRNFEHLRPLTTVSLLAYLYKQGNIEYDVFFEKSLYLFKNKEIDNVLNDLSRQNLNTNRQDQIAIINDCKKNFKYRFDLYREPLNKELSRIWSTVRVQT
ncbi:hypothetical protein HWN40_13190 [Methanolobus zinderi]|uniref:PIN domain-containing protein n=1 Tax=Methanolobus zinderi TaxID=536044 RepID=A0A7D5I6A5_9EURY|nr:hypothetical protein [Methanolobus zinderi]QLC51104.1 hypothetical protein HWN40_13190 [Methanolobus zinderi]